VEHGLPKFLDGIDQSGLFQRQQILVQPVVLLAGHAALQDVHRDAGQMCGSGVAFLRSGVVVASPQLLLLIDGAHQRGNHDGLMKLAIVGVAQIFQKIARPGTAVAAIPRQV
jgi:hypothetical protein